MLDTETTSFVHVNEVENKLTVAHPRGINLTSDLCAHPLMRNYFSMGRMEMFYDGIQPIVKNSLIGKVV